MNEEQKEQLKFLLADFQAAKNEISRRSDLQKVVLMLLVSFHAWFITTQDLFSIDKIGILWLVVILAYIFYDREAKEISRLGLIISSRICKYVSEILGKPSTQIIPTEVHESAYPTDELTRKYDIIFNSAIFLIIPVFYTVLFICCKNICS